MVFCLIRNKLLWRRKLLMRSRVLRSKGTMSLFRLPFVYFLFFFMVGFWLYKPFNYDN